MKVSQIIKVLQEFYSPDDVVVIAWWNKELFQEAYDLPDEDWEAAAESMENMDWSRTHEDLLAELGHWIDLGEGEAK